MQRIIVEKPFRLHAEGSETRLLGKGEQTLTDEELKHWFVQACLAEGRARMPEEQKVVGTGGTAPDEAVQAGSGEKRRKG